MKKVVSHAGYALHKKLYNYSTVVSLAHSHVINVQTFLQTRSSTFSNLFSRDNEVLGLGDLMPEIEAGTFNLSYPITFHPDTFKQYNLPVYFGGIQQTDEGTVSKVLQCCTVQ